MILLLTQMGRQLAAVHLHWFPSASLLVTCLMFHSILHLQLVVLMQIVSSSVILLHAIPLCFMKPQTSLSTQTLGSGATAAVWVSSF